MIIAIFENQPHRLTEFRRWAVSYTIRKNIEFDILSFSDRNAVTTFEKYANSISIAFISLDNDYGMEIGKKLAILSPYCISCYISRSTRPLEFMRHTRFYEFLVGESIENKLDEMMDLMIDASIRSGGVYRHISRKELLLFPINAITYFQSDLKYVNVNTIIELLGQKTERQQEKRLYLRLSDVENELIQQNLRWHFVRIHKSFLVNMLYIIEINKNKKLVRLSTGEELPVSDTYYKKVMDRISI